MMNVENMSKFMIPSSGPFMYLQSLFKNSLLKAFLKLHPLSDWLLCDLINGRLKLRIGFHLITVVGERECVLVLYFEDESHMLPARKKTFVCLVVVL